MANLVLESWRIHCFLAMATFDFLNFRGNSLNCRKQQKWQILPWQVLLIISPSLTWQNYLHPHGNFNTLLPWQVLLFIFHGKFTFINMANSPKSPWQYLTFIAMASFT